MVEEELIPERPIDPVVRSLHPSLAFCALTAIISTALSGARADLTLPLPYWGTEQDMILSSFWV